MAAFIIWTVMGAMFIIMGIVDIFSKKQKAFGFWANAQTLPIENIKGYNRALGILWIVYGIILILLGLPLLQGDNSPGVIITILGTMFEAIAAMAVYVVVIEKKYRKK
ncbi:MAG: hypothetical protein IKL78_07000 [Lachnospiraceae bacterium]|nr:hypothetical protein [Lachnospiraceae bacterium]